MKSTKTYNWKNEKGTSFEIEVETNHNTETTYGVDGINVTKADEYYNYKVLSCKINGESLKVMDLNLAWQIKANRNGQIGLVIVPEEIVNEIKNDEKALAIKNMNILNKQINEEAEYQSNYNRTTNAMNI